MKTIKLSVLVVTALTIGIASCKKDAKETTPTKVTVTDSIEVPFSSNTYTFFSFNDSAVVAHSDSATNKWDFGIRFVSIITNSHASGPGTAGVITQSGLFDSYTTAPESGYAYDTSKTSLAINSNFNDPNSWYTYDDATHAFFPKAGKFFIFKTADNHYAKMEILSVGYKGYTPPNPTPTTLVYKFRYTYQSDGSRNF